MLELTQERRNDLKEEICGILARGELTPGSAGRLKGKLLFAAGQIWGKVGRSFMLALSERQFAKHRSYDNSVKINDAIELALIQWLKILENGRPRDITTYESAKVDGVIFVDGMYPDRSRGETGEPRVGGVIFMKDRPKPLAFSRAIGNDLIDHWIGRKNQISMIELIAPIIALATFPEEVRNKKIIIFVDSEVAEGNLIKGYSSRQSDLCELGSVFWDMTMKLDTLVYIDRVSTDANIADDPSRDKMEIVGELGWHWSEAVIPDCVLPRYTCTGLGIR